MENLSSYIHALLLKQDNLVIPKFGGFVARRVPARLSVDGHKLLPPFKQLLFNAQLNLSDGLLEQYIAFKEGVTNVEAMNLIADEVGKWQNNLTSGGRVELENIGFFFLDQDKKLRFEQDKSSNLLIDAFGLGELIFHQALDEDKGTVQAALTAVDITKMERSEKTEDSEFTEPILHFEANNNLGTPQKSENKEKLVLVQEGIRPTRTAKSIWYKVAAAAVLAPFTFYMFWVPLNSDVLETKKIAFSDFNPFRKSVEVQYNTKSLKIEEEIEQTPQEDLQTILNKLPADAEVYHFNYDDELVLTLGLEKKPSAKIEPLAPKKSTSFPAQQQETKQDYSKHLITGCFSESTNAQNHINDLKKLGFNAYLVDVKGGLHRVSAAGFHKNDEISTGRKALDEKGIAFWVLSN